LIALGNSLVPHLAQMIGETILWRENPI
jgi:hypothetical protein